jgi:hypothetical protein
VAKSGQSGQKRPKWPKAAKVAKSGQHICKQRYRNHNFVFTGQVSYQLSQHDDGDAISLIPTTKREKHEIQIFTPFPFRGRDGVEERSARYRTFNSMFNCVYSPLFGLPLFNLPAIWHGRVINQQKRKMAVNFKFL